MSHNYYQLARPRQSCRRTRLIRGASRPLLPYQTIVSHPGEGASFRFLAIGFAFAPHYPVTYRAGRSSKRLYGDRRCCWASPNVGGKPTRIHCVDCHGFPTRTLQRACINRARDGQNGANDLRGCRAPHQTRRRARHRRAATYRLSRALGRSGGQRNAGGRGAGSVGFNLIPATDAVFGAHLPSHCIHYDLPYANESQGLPRPARHGHSSQHC